MVIKKLLVVLHNGVSSFRIQSGRVAYGFGLCVGLSLVIFYVLVPICSHTAPPVSSIASPPFFTWFSTAPATHQHGGSARNRTAVNPPEPGGSLDKGGSLGVGNSTAADVLVLEHRNATEEAKGLILGGTHVETGKCEASGNGTEATGIDSDERRRGKFGSLGGGSSSGCDMFDGKWVRDNRKPFYPPGFCPYIDMSFNCHKNGRPDRDFLKWRWQPNACNIPRMNATDFLERLRGQRLVFVGDSLNRNMWESLVCTLRQSLANKRRASEISGRPQFKARGYYSFTFKDYGCSVEFVRAPFLVKEARKLRLDLLEESASVYRKADIIVFNTGHWWTHEKTAKGIDYYQVGNYVYPVLPLMDAYEQGLHTWARWVDKNINREKTLVFFRGFSTTHFRGGRWNSGGKCHNETEPIFNETFLGEYPSLMFTLEKTLKKMKTPVTYLNISRLTDYRKDGHPSIYRMKYKSIEEQIASLRSQDCSHWCLPGIPDAWNELLYASLLRIGRGKWRN